MWCFVFVFMQSDVFISCFMASRSESIVKNALLTLIILN